MLTGGKVSCWGYNNHGQIGNATTIDQLTPASVNGLADATMVSTGSAHTCALLADGSIRCWGYNYFGETGDKATTSKCKPSPSETVTSCAAQMSSTSSQSASVTSKAARARPISPEPRM